MIKAIEIVERGRGPQLSTCRITVQDLVPYLRRQCSYEQILEAMPVLSIAEIRVIEEYVQKNRDAVMEQDRIIRERNALRKNPGEIEAIRQQGAMKMASLRKQREAAQEQR